MICNRTETGWELIYQQAHALLAAKLATYWREAERPPRWTETLNAIAHHDNGWQEWEQTRQLTAVGIPMNFTEARLEEVVQQAHYAVTRAWHQSLWTGLLVSKHISHLYEAQRDQLKALDELLEAQKALRRKWRRSLKVTKKAVNAAYSLLLWADAFSLILCRHDLPSDERAIEIGKGPDGTRYDAIQRADGTITVTPWPYEQAAFKASVDTYHLSQLTFENEAELATAVQKAKPYILEWELVKE